GAVARRLRRPIGRGRRHRRAGQRSTLGAAARRIAVPVRRLGAGAAVSGARLRAGRLRVAVPAGGPAMSLALDLQALLGLAVFVALALPFSESVRAIRWRAVAIAIVLEFVICIVLLRVPPIAAALAYLNHAVAALSAATLKGTSFVFGYVGGGAPPF